MCQCEKKWFKPDNCCPPLQVFSVDGRDADDVAPFNELSYSITGDDNAPAFFAINDEGKITVRADLTTAPGSEIQYKVRLIEYGRPCTLWKPQTNALCRESSEMWIW